MYIFLLIFIIALILFWPGKGLWHQWQIMKKERQRIYIEDALKHFYEFEQKKMPCTTNSIAGSLNVNRDQAVSLLKKLEKLRLIQSRDEQYILTKNGREYALRIIRIHRLLELYLAEQTGVPEDEWHNAAEKREHHIPEEEIASLDKKLGKPLYDPHGDPIPDEHGTMPPERGKPLNELNEGDFAEITHIEDEPPSVYNEILQYHLNPDDQIEVIEITKDYILIRASGENIKLSRLAASNIEVNQISGKDFLHGPFETLDKLEPGEKGKVLLLSKACRGQQRRRLMDLGVVPGSVISTELKSLSGDPIAFNIKGAVIALRKNHAQHIFIKRV